MTVLFESNPPGWDTNNIIMKAMYISSVIIEITCIVLAMLVFFSIRNSKNQTRDKKLLICIIKSFVILAGTDSFNWLAIGGIYVLPYYLNELVNAVCFCAAGAGCYYWFLYMEERVEVTILKNKMIRNVFKAPIILLYVLDFVSIFTHWIFYIQSNGAFYDGPLFILQEFIPLFYLFTAFVHLIIEIACHRDKNKKFEFSLYLLFILFSVFSVFFEDMLPTLPVGTLSMLIMIEVMFFTIYLDQERKLTEYRTAIVVSQIKPHFIFNVLTAIQVLCKEKAPEAAKLIEQFADYLRLNIDSLEKSEPIPFADELKHTENYLSIEKTRFGDRLKVEYDIQTTQFKIPALSMQPIVENAVKYGLKNNIEGVTVHISVKKEGSDFVIRVADTGGGFDPKAVKNDGREHIGLKNSTERIQTMSSGKVSINSVIGEGTTVTIAIPEQEGL